MKMFLPLALFCFMLWPNLSHSDHSSYSNVPDSNQRKCPPSEDCGVVFPGCTTDESCGPKQRCCPIKCGTKCFEVSTLNEDKPAECPASDECAGIFDGCFGDEHCADLGPNYRCCPISCGAKCLKVREGY